MSHPQEITDEYRFYLLRKRLAENLILGAFRGFRREGIEPILIKGWAADRNYPASRPRFFGDIDLAVSAADFDAARKLISSGSTIGGVDLHRELEHLDTLGWESLISNSQVVKLEGEDIRILCAEDHLRVMCVHWLTDGGERRERLWDIFYAVQNRPAEFDWSKCVDVVSETRRQWIITSIGIAHKYLDLDLSGIPFAEEARDLPVWLTRCLEREWARNLEIRPLHSQLKYPLGLLRQVRKRIPPNPIQATINCEGDFRKRTRVGYQIRDMFKRILPGIKRISNTIVEKPS
ncbi:MAG TPA: nucleotidyltransferase family protein [Pyrinomonadaceae bacterium]|nr:nucleotidyltransferase family protein [Pyrinomonadaceae bacterium]